MTKKICDFCLSESKFRNRVEQLPDGHYICKNCRDIIEEHDLPVRFDLFQQLVTAQSDMTDTVMDSYLENHSADDTIAKFYPLPSVVLHEGEHCLNQVEAALTVNTSDIPSAYAVRNLMEINRTTIHNIPDAKDKDRTKITGTLYETEAAVYFMSEHIVNCHRLGYLKRNTADMTHVNVVTPTRTFTYSIEHADLFFFRERFFQKVNAVKQHKQKHLIYIQNNDDVRITPGIYDIPKSFRPGVYKVTAVTDAGLHIRDSHGRVRDYYETEETIALDSGTLECTGEYELTWVGEDHK
jgi:hypothetical protein